MPPGALPCDMKEKTVELLQGKKTYIVAGLMVAYAVLGMSLGYQEPTDAFQLILEAMGLVGLRLGVAKAEV